MFDGSSTFEVSLDAIPTTDIFDTFTKTLCVGSDNVTLVLHFMVSRLGIIVAPIIDLPGRPVESFLHLVQNPFRIFAVGESLSDVLLFFLEQLRIAAHGGGPVGEGLDDNLARNIKESIYIRVNNPTLNNNIGKFNLSHIWDRVLIITKGLTLK